MSRRVVPWIALALVASACSSSSSGDDGRPLVVTTVSPITNLVHNVGGDAVRVVGLVPEGRNSHEFEPVPSDVRVLAQADLMIANGLNLELPSIRLAQANLRDGVEIVELAAAVIGPEEYIYDFSFPEEEGDPNPHLWTNPPYAKAFVEHIATALVRIAPSHADAFRANAAALAERFDALDRALRRATRSVPPANRVLLTYHDSFPYMARAYGWTVIGAIQPSDFSEPSAREVADLIEQIRARGVPAIFGSEVFPSSVLGQIARESGARYIDDLRDDDLPGAVGEDAHSLLGLLVFDFHVVVTALGGDPAPFDDVDVANLHPETAGMYR